MHNLTLQTALYMTLGVLYQNYMLHLSDLNGIDLVNTGPLYIIKQDEKAVKIPMLYKCALCTHVRSLICPMNQPI